MATDLFVTNLVLFDLSSLWPQCYASLLTNGDGGKKRKSKDIHHTRQNWPFFFTSVSHTVLSKISNYKHKVVANYNAFVTTCDLFLYYLQTALAGAESTIALFCASYGHLGNLIFRKNGEVYALGKIAH